VAENKTEIHGLKEAQALVKDLGSRLADPTDAMDDIGNQLVDSIHRNFEVGGRPAWPDLKPSTWKRKTTNKILIERGKRGGLFGSIGYKLESGGRHLIVGAIQYDAPHAAAHQFGLKGSIEQQVGAHVRRAHYRTTKKGPVFVPEHQVGAFTRTINQNIPARPFVVIQDEDLIEIERILARFLIAPSK
jgi:phage gpG-like protein